ASRDRVARDRSDDRAWQLVDRERHRVDRRDHATAILGFVRWRELEIDARREEPGAPGKHEGARWIVGERLHARDDLLQQREVHRVGRRAIGAQHGHAVAVVARRDVTHRRSLCVTPRAGASQDGRALSLYAGWRRIRSSEQFTTTDRYAQGWQAPYSSAPTS